MEWDGDAVEIFETTMLRHRALVSGLGYCVTMASAIRQYRGRVCLSVFHSDAIANRLNVNQSHLHSSSILLSSANRSIGQRLSYFIRTPTDNLPDLARVSIKKINFSFFSYYYHQFHKNAISRFCIDCWNSRVTTEANSLRVVESKEIWKFPKFFPRFANISIKFLILCKLNFERITKDQKLAESCTSSPAVPKLRKFKTPRNPAILTFQNSRTQR